GRQVQIVRTNLTMKTATSKREAKAKEPIVTQLRTQLEALAEKHQKEIETDGELPRDEEIRIRRLDQQLRFAEWDVKIANQAAENNEKAVKKLREFDEQLNTAGGEF